MDALSLLYNSSGPVATSGKQYVLDIPFADKLFGNSPKVFPNPFAESVKIRYTLKQKANVVLSVYSIQGQQLKLLVNSVKEKGTYEANFNAAKLSAGMYFYRLQAGNEVKTGKLIKK